MDAAWRRSALSECAACFPISYVCLFFQETKYFCKLFMDLRIQPNTQKNMYALLKKNQVYFFEKLHLFSICILKRCCLYITDKQDSHIIIHAVYWRKKYIPTKLVDKFVLRYFLTLYARFLLIKLSKSKKRTIENMPHDYPVFIPAVTERKK